LEEASNYEIGDSQISIQTFFSSIKFSRMDLNTDEAELNYVLDKLIKMEEMNAIQDNWRDTVQTWISLMNLSIQMRSKKGANVIKCITSDKGVEDALSSANALSGSIGRSSSIAANLSNNPGRYIRDHGYTYQEAITEEIARIQKIRESQILLISFIRTTIASLMIAVFDDVLQVTGNYFAKWAAFIIGGISVLFYHFWYPFHVLQQRE